MDDKKFRDFLERMVAILRDQGLKKKDIAEILNVGGSTLDKYLSKSSRYWCRLKSKQDKITNNLKTVLGEEKVNYVLNQFGMIVGKMDTVDIVGVRKESIDSKPKSKVYSMHSSENPMEQTLLSLTNQRDSVSVKIQAIMDNLRGLQSKEKALSDAIEALNKVMEIASGASSTEQKGTTRVG